MVFGLSKGLVFISSSLLLQNIIFVPVILALGVSGLKLYKAIVKDKKRDNIRLEILRHLIFSLIMTLLLIISSLIEVFISTNILKFVISYWF